jgi:hypothetical protein
MSHLGRLGILRDNIPENLMINIRGKIRLYEIILKVNNKLIIKK